MKYELQVYPTHVMAQAALRDCDVSNGVTHRNRMAFESGDKIVFFAACANEQDTYRWAGYNFSAITFHDQVPRKVRERLLPLLREPQLQ